MKPSLIIRADERTQGSSLKTKSLQILKSTLQPRGFVMLPSDTCYSLATLPNEAEAFTRTNKVLQRAKDPVSLVFTNLDDVEKWTKLTIGSAALLEQFTPGPITVVCQAGPNVPPVFTTKGINSAQNSIGVRISDSQIEREVSNCTEYPLTTVAVRDPQTKEAVTDFDKALDIVEAGIKKAKIQIEWCAIEGGKFYNKHSTVVRVNSESNKVELLREGDIPFTDIEKAYGMLPRRAYSDWI